MIFKIESAIIRKMIGHASRSRRNCLSPNPIFTVKCIEGLVVRKSSNAYNLPIMCGDANAS